MPVHVVIDYSEKAPLDFTLRSGGIFFERHLNEPKTDIRVTTTAGEPLIALDADTIKSLVPRNSTVIVSISPSGAHAVAH